MKIWDIGKHRGSWKDYIIPYFSYISRKESGDAYANFKVYFLQYMVEVEL